MASLALLKLLEQSRSVATGSYSSADGQDEYRFSGLLDAPIEFGVITLTRPARLTVVVRDGEANVTIGEDIYPVTPGFPLHMDVQSGREHSVTPNPNQPCYVEILVHLSDDPTLVTRYLWLRASEGVVQSGGSVQSWQDTRNEALTNLPFVRSSITGSGIYPNDVVLEERAGRMAVKFDATHGTAQLLYSGASSFGVPNGLSAANPYTLIMVAEWPDEGHHQSLFGCGSYDGVSTLRTGGFWGVEGGHRVYFGSHVSTSSYAWLGGTEEVPKGRPCILVFTSDGAQSGTQTVNLRMPGGGFTRTWSFDSAGNNTCLRSIPYLGGARRSGTGYNNNTHVSNAWLFELQWHNRVLEESEILEQVARIVDEYGIEDTYPAQAGVDSQAALYLRASRGVARDTTSLNPLAISRWYDTRLDMVGTAGRYLTASTGALQILRGEGDYGPEVQFPDATEGEDDDTPKLSWSSGDSFATGQTTAGATSFTLGIVGELWNPGAGDEVLFFNSRDDSGYPNGTQVHSFGTPTSALYASVIGTGGTQAFAPPVPVPVVSAWTSFNRSAGAHGQLTCYSGRAVGGTVGSLSATSSATAGKVLDIGGTADVNEATARAPVGGILEVVMRTTHTTPATLSGYCDYLEEAYGIEFPS